jgi:multidrug efflux pump subunit AcrB
VNERERDLGGPDGAHTALQPPPSHPFFAGLVRRPVFLSTLFLTCVVIGLISWARIPIQMMPGGIVNPGLLVYVLNSGASATENEERVARVIEEELRTLPAVEEIGSESEADSVRIFVQFEASTDMSFAKAEVRDRIERARPKVPATVQEIGIFSWSRSDLPIMWFALKHPGDSERTDFLVEKVIQRRLEAVDGVGKVEVWGSLDDSLRILLDETKVRAARLDLGALVRRLATDNFSLSLGEVADGGSRILLRSDMRFRSQEEILDYPVGDGLRIRDIATVVAVKSVRESLFRIDGQYAYFIEIRKDGQANVVETCHRLQEELARIEKAPELNGEFTFVPIFDQGKYIEGALRQLTDSAWEGGILAIVILFFFLWRVRQTLLVALAIPISVLLAIAWCFFTGRSFNILTMTGITLSLGMLVDNAIVVIENITRLRQAGHSPRASVVEGTGEVARAVTLSTLTVVVAFLPLIFMTENPTLRIILGELGLPLCVALLISLLVALIFLPVAAEWSIGTPPAWLTRTGGRFERVAALPARGVAWLASSVRWLIENGLRTLHATLGAFFRGAARVRWLLAALVCALAGWRAWEARGWLAASEPWRDVAAITSARAPFGVPLLALYGACALCAAVLLVWRVPAAARALAVARPRAPRRAIGGRSVVGLIVDANHSLVQWSLQHRFAATLVSVLCLGTILIPLMNMSVAAFGQDENRTQVRVRVELEDNFTLAQAADELRPYEEFLDTKRAQYGFQRIGVRFTRLSGSLRLYWDERQKRAHLDEVTRDLQAHLPRLSGHRLRFVDDDANAESQSKNVITFRLLGPDSEELARHGERAVQLLEAVPGIESVMSPLETAPPQVQLSIDSDVAQKLGVTPRDALENVSWALRGAQLPRYQEAGREIPLLIEYDSAQVPGLDTLRELEVYNGTSAVPLTSFSELEFGHGSRTIWRRNGQASFTIQARIANPTQQKELTDAGYRALSALDLPRGFSLGLDDSASSRQEQELGALFLALLFSILLVFFVMGVLFESFALPFSVLATVPYAVLGAYWGLYALGTAMDSIGWIGIIILVGVEVNHGIVLIDRVHQLRQRGMERAAAVLEGCGNRVRPILMTALTSVIGLMPMILKEPPGDGIDFRALATCVASGLVVSTIFTLWVVPLAYTLIDDFTVAVARQLGWSLRPAGRSAASARAEVAPEPGVSPVQGS